MMTASSSSTPCAGPRALATILAVLLFVMPQAAGAQPLADTGGGWVLLRDAFEAVSQGWDHYVVGYDLPTQWQLFQRMHQRFEHGRVDAAVRRGEFDLGGLNTEGVGADEAGGVDAVAVGGAALELAGERERDTVGILTAEADVLEGRPHAASRDSPPQPPSMPRRSWLDRIYGGSDCRPAA
jgi:hypothetical protein